MFRYTKEPWIFTLRNKLSRSFYYMNIVIFILYFVVSTQGISIYWAKSILNINTSISIISIILLTLTFLDLFTKKDKILIKINFIIGKVLNLIISFIILIISYSINVLSSGNWEQIW